MKSKTQSSPDNFTDHHRLLLIDGHALIYRAFHAFPELTDSQGRLVNAVYGFSRILLTSIRDFHPEYLAVCFDHKEKTHRAEEFDGYKANRAPMPDALQPQIEIIKSVVEALNIPQFSLAGYEADDLIGTIAGIIDDKPGMPQVLIVTGDRDLLQLVTANVHVFIPGRSRTQPEREYDRELVKQIMGVYPEQIPDLKGLMGDASDNIPGVPGIGPKGAQGLMDVFGGIDNLLQAVDLLTTKSLEAKVKPEYKQILTDKILAKLVQGRESAIMSRDLATIKTDVPLQFVLEDCRVRKYDKEKAIQILDTLDFRSLIGLLPQDEFESSVQQALF